MKFTNNSFGTGSRRSGSIYIIQILKREVNMVDIMLSGSVVSYAIGLIIMSLIIIVPLIVFARAEE